MPRIFRTVLNRLARRARQYPCRMSSPMVVRITSLSVLIGCAPRIMPVCVRNLHTISDAPWDSQDRMSLRMQEIINTLIAMRAHPIQDAHDGVSMCLHFPECPTQQRQHVLNSVAPFWCKLDDRVFAVTRCDLSSDSPRTSLAGFHFEQHSQTRRPAICSSHRIIGCGVPDTHPQL